MKFLLGTLSISLLAGMASASGGAPAPVPGETRVLGTLIKTNIVTREAVVEFKSVTFPDGTELNYGQVEQKTIKIPTSTPVHFSNTPFRWLSLHEVPVGASIAGYVFQTDRNDWDLDHLLVLRDDPIIPDDKPYEPGAPMDVANDSVTKDRVEVPMIFPIAGGVRFSDTFLASRGGGTRRHQGQDLMAPKMTPLVACFAGTVHIRSSRGNAGNIITIIGDNGWTAQYYHVNNDTPGTDDGDGTEDYAFAPGLMSGQRVYAGQFVGWVGDSGNAEGTAPHLHFELWHRGYGAVYNAYPSLRSAKKIGEPLLFLPYPDLAPKAGQERLDGVLRAVDKARGVLVIDLLSTQKPGGRPDPISRPVRRYTRVQDASDIINLGGGDLKIEELQPGSRIAVFQTQAKSGQAGNMMMALLGDADTVLKRPEVEANKQTVPPAREIQPDPNQGTVLITSNDDRMTKAVAIIINKYRAKKKLPELYVESHLIRVAQQHSLNMTTGDFFDLTDPSTRRSVFQAARNEGMNGRVEAMIASVNTAQELANQIISNYPDLLYDESLIRIGVGHVYMDYDPGRVQVRNYWTLLLSE